jgi:hypothetical protein
MNAMDTTIVLALCAVAEVFMVYVLAQFVQEGMGRQRIHAVATIAVIGRKHSAHLAHSKAA